jgi:hypothetical protein
MSFGRRFCQTLSAFHVLDWGASYISQTFAIDHESFYRRKDMTIDTNIDEINITKKSAVVTTCRQTSSEKMTMNSEELVGDA